MSYGSLILTQAWSATGMCLSVASSSVPEIDPAGLESVLSLLAGTLALVERRRRTACGRDGGSRATAAG